MRLTGGVKPAAGARLSLMLACFGPNGSPSIGGHFQFSFEGLSHAKKLAVPVDRNGEIVDAYGGGVYIIE